MMKKVIAVLGAATLLLTGATAGLAVPASADDPPPAPASTEAPTSKTVAVMPGPLKGLLLQDAFDAVAASLVDTRSANIPVVAKNITGAAQVILNTTNWIVCKQDPGAGKKISNKRTVLILLVRRPGFKCNGQPL